MSTEYSLTERDEPALSGLERRIHDAVSVDEPWALVKEFAELERVSGSEDERIAADYIEDRLDALEIEYERYEPKRWISVPEDASLRLDGETYEETVKTVAFSAEGTARGEVVYLPSEASDTREGSLGGTAVDVDLDLSGKVVVMETSGLPIRTLLDVEAMGASAFVGVHPNDEEPHEGIATGVWGAVPGPEDHNLIPSIPIVNVTTGVGDRLAASEGSEVQVSAQAPRDWYDLPIVVAHIEGGKSDGDEFALLHGHYDSWYCGVTDNATGDAALLECARVLSDFSEPLRRDVRVAWWPGHSTGRYAGSTWYADEFSNDLRDHCVGHMDIDSPGVADATEFDDLAMWMSEADALCRGAIDDVTGKEAIENRPVRAGDYSFNNLGITGLFMVSSSIPDEVRDDRGYYFVVGSAGNSAVWHRSTDTLEHADPDVLVRDIRIHLMAAWRLLTAEVLPFNFRHTVAQHREVIAEYDEVAGEAFDLSPVGEELATLEAAVGELYDGIDAGEIDPRVANEAIRDLSRRLVRLNFVTEGPFEQDPAMTRPPYPSLEPATELPDLAGDKYEFRRVHLKRKRNAAVGALRKARDEVRRQL